MRPTDDPGATFDALVARSLSRASTTPSGPTQRVKLRVHPELRPAARPDVRRDLAPWLPPALRAVIRGLLAGERPWPLYLYGASGVGKTSAALLMLDACGPPANDRAASGRVADWYAGYADLRDIPGLKIDADRGHLTWSGSGESCGGGTYTWDQLRAVARGCPLFVFDEAGVGAAADFRLDAVLEVIGLRCVDPVRPFVTTGNVPPDELARLYDQRVARRVTWGTVVRWDRKPAGVTVWERQPDGEFRPAEPKESP